MKDKIILIISTEPWGTNFVSKHHYASTLAKNGNTVYFLNPPSGKINISKESNNLFIIDFYSLKGINRFPKWVRRFLYSRLWNKISTNLNLPDPEIVWSFNPFVFQDLNIFNKKAIKIYHPVDVHFTNLEFENASTANFVFSCSNSILDKFKQINVPKIFINHGLAEHFTDGKPYDYSLFPEIKDDKNFKVGYVGNLLYQHLNYEILLQLIESYPQIDFYFLGPFKPSNLNLNSKNFVNEIEKLKTFKNVILLGPRPSSQIPTFLSSMDLLMMCYNGDKKPEEMANPHKLLEYLSSGKKVITHFIKEYANRNDLVFMVNDNNNFIERFGEVLKLEDTESGKKNRIEFAYQNSYAKQLEKIESIIFRNK